MTFQKLLFGLGFFSAISFLAWIGIFLFVDPDAYGIPGVLLFLGTAFSFLTGLFTVLLVRTARHFLGESGAEAAFGVFFRQGFFLATFVIASLILSSLRILAWWNVALVAVGILLTELSIRTAGDGRRHNSRIS